VKGVTADSRGTRRDTGCILFYATLVNPVNISSPGTAKGRPWSKSIFFWIPMVNNLKTESEVSQFPTSSLLTGLSLVSHPVAVAHHIQNTGDTCPLVRVGDI